MADGGGVAAGIDAVARHLGTSADEVRRSWASPRGSRRRWIDAGFFIDD
jgi:hypothetical protein